MFFRVRHEAVMWRISNPKPNAALSLIATSDSVALPAVSKTFATWTCACGAMHRRTPATNVPCPP
jgi:hypothetical protein